MNSSTRACGTARDIRGTQVVPRLEFGEYGGSEALYTEVALARYVI